MDRYLELLKHAVRTKGWDFSAKYLAVCEIHSLAKEETDVICSDTLRSLESLFEDKAVCGQTQAFFLFKEAADIFCSVIVRPCDESRTDQAVEALKKGLKNKVQPVRRAVAEAMGALPFSVHGPVIQAPDSRGEARVSWNDLVEKAGASAYSDPEMVGRSLVLQTAHEGELLVIKLARAEESPAQLASEALWMEQLRSGKYEFPVRFDIPAPLCFQDDYVFKLADMPVDLKDKGPWHPERFAMAYRTTEDYFSYPNESDDSKRLPEDQLLEVLLRNARLFGALTSAGIVHTAPIPLFHNRVQRGRREDGGVYEWPLRGRLDKWLQSCAYPNFGVSGVRDFEHFSGVRGPGRRLYRCVGTQLLSLLLVSASYFRNKEPDRIGLGEDGLPMDARDLFDVELLENLILGIFLHFYEGFVGAEYEGDLPFDVSGLADRMVDEMGVDRHMDELLRVADQERMTEDEFKMFLRDRGVSEHRLETLHRGEEEIGLVTGPHLGAFNSGISLPELIDFIETATALCMLGRYYREKAAPVGGKSEAFMQRASGEIF